MKMFSHSRWNFLEWETFRIKFVEKTETHTLWSINFSSKSCRLWHNVEKYMVKPYDHSWRYNTAHALCLLDKQGYTQARKSASPRTRASTHTHTHIHARACTRREIRKTYCFSTATMVSWTRVIVKLYVHCLFYFLPLVNTVMNRRIPRNARNFLTNWSAWSCAVNKLDGNEWLVWLVLWSSVWTLRIPATWRHVST